MNFEEGYVVFLVVPLYVSIWFVLRAVQGIVSQRFAWRMYVSALLWALPFWVGSVLASLYYYFSLPEQPPRMGY